MECGASMNSGGSLGISGSSIPTNCHRTLFAKNSALKLAPSKRRVISEAMRVAGSKSLEAGRGWPAHGVQLTYKDMRLEERHLKRMHEEVWETRTTELTSSEVNPARCALIWWKLFRTRSVLGVIRPYLTTYCYKKKHKPQVGCKITICKMADAR